MHTASPPFFTIVTATYNAAETLSRLLTSLAEQTCQDFVWACQDGASSDTTMDIVPQWKDKFSISVESCKDNGIYDAWNKAITRQGDNLGEWVLFLGADDLLLEPETLEKVKAICKNTSPDVLFVAGNLYKFDERDITTLAVEVDVKNIFKNLSSCMAPHTALFSRKKTLQQEFDTNFKICGDHDWLHRVWLKEVQMIPLGFFVSKMQEGGVSCNLQMKKTLYQERKKIAWTYKYKTSPYKILQMVAYVGWLCYPFKVRVKEIIQKGPFGNALWSLLSKAKRFFYNSNS